MDRIEKGEPESEISKGVGDFELRKNRTHVAGKSFLKVPWGGSRDQVLVRVLLPSILNSDEAKVNKARFLSQNRSFHPNLLGRKGGGSNILSESCVFESSLKATSPKAKL